MQQQYQNISGIIEMCDKAHFKDYTPRASISLLPINIEIIAEEKKWNRVEFINDKTGELILYSEPPSRREYGIFAWLKYIHFYVEDKLIAEIRYSSWLGQPYFIANGEESTINIKKTRKEIVYKSDNFQIVSTHGRVSTSFEISDEKYLYPCIGFSHYIWARKWS